MIGIFHKGTTELWPRTRQGKYKKDEESGLILHSGKKKEIGGKCKGI